MADIELVIKIPEEKYLYAKNLVNGGKENNPVVLAIGNGTPLPKGHGRLKDIEPITESMNILDQIRAEIERQEKWLLQAGYNQYNVDIAFSTIKSLLAESEVKNEVN